MPGWISNYILYKPWYEFAYPFLNFNCAANEFGNGCEISPMHYRACSYLFMPAFNENPVSKRGPRRVNFGTNIISSSGFFLSKEGDIVVSWITNSTGVHMLPDSPWYLSVKSSKYGCDGREIQTSCSRGFTWSCYASVIACHWNDMWSLIKIFCHFEKF